MTTTIQAFKSSSGAIFETRAEADRDELISAAEVVASCDKEMLFRMATGNRVCDITADAILRIAQAIKEMPRAEQATKAA